jgi:hypothetical protein
MSSYYGQQLQNQFNGAVLIFEKSVVTDYIGDLICGREDDEADVMAMISNTTDNADGTGNQNSSSNKNSTTVTTTAITGDASNRSNVSNVSNVSNLSSAITTSAITTVKSENVNSCDIDTAADLEAPNASSKLGIFESLKLILNQQQLADARIKWKKFWEEIENSEKVLEQGTHSRGLGVGVNTGSTGSGFNTGSAKGSKGSGGSAKGSASSGKGFGKQGGKQSKNQPNNQPNNQQQLSPRNLSPGQHAKTQPNPEKWTHPELRRSIFRERKEKFCREIVPTEIFRKNIEFYEHLALKKAGEAFLMELHDFGRFYNYNYSRERSVSPVGGRSGVGSGGGSASGNKNSSGKKNSGNAGADTNNVKTNPLTPRDQGNLQNASTSQQQALSSSNIIIPKRVFQSHLAPPRMGSNRHFLLNLCWQMCQTLCQYEYGKASTDAGQKDWIGGGDANGILEVES